MALLISLTLLPACDEDEISVTTVTFGYEMPSWLGSDYNATFKMVEIQDVASNVIIDYDVDDLEDGQVPLPDGLYNMTMTIKITRIVAGEEVEETYRDSQSMVLVSNGQLDVFFKLVRIPGGQGFVFADVMLISAPPEGASTYRGDAWFRIFNNSADTLYADGLCLMESAFTTVQERAYDPDIRSEALAVQSLYQVPGSGRDVPVAPGASLLIADQGRDHTADNPNSPDLSKADFEWYDETSNAMDIDSDVPNLNCVYKLSKTIWLPTVKYNRTYAIGYLGGDDKSLSADDYLAGYQYDCSYVSVISGVEKKMSFSYYKFPNDWILDAVSFAPANDWQWNVVDQSVDASCFAMADTGSDDKRFGFSARRKFQNGMMVDTNNSASDFERAEANPYYIFQ